MAASLDDTGSPGQEKGWVPLMRAAEAGDIDTLTTLLTGGCDIDINARDYDGCTSLALAAQNGHAAVVEQLLEHNADPNFSDLDQVTPLWKAAQYGHTSVVQLLLASTKLLDVNPRPAYLHEHKLETPLSIAIKAGHQETAGLLSRADGINPCLTTLLNKGFLWTHREEIIILSLAIRTASEDMALSLLDQCDIGQDSEDDGDNGTKDTIEPASKLLVFAVAAGCSRIVGELLTKHGPDINAVHRYYAGEAQGWVKDSPLMAASRRGDLNTVRLLLNIDGIRLDVSSTLSGTALTVAAQGGFVDVVKVLVADGRIELGYCDGYRCNALSLAAESGAEAVVGELLGTGAFDVNSQDSFGRTPLIMAANPWGGYGPGGWKSYEGVIRGLLADSQIVINAKDSDERTALFYAARNGALALVIALLEHPQIDSTDGFNWKFSLAEAAENGHADVVRALLSKGRVNVNAVVPDVYGRTTLIRFAEFGRGEYESTAKVLLSTPGIDVDFQDREGRTALMLAARRDTAVMVKLLLAYGADPNIKNDGGGTAICQAQNVEIIKALLEVPGIKPDLPDNIGRTALSIAAEDGQIDNVKALLARDDVDPDARDIHGRGPLSWVFGNNGLQDSWDKEKRKAVLVQLLRTTAVDPNAEDHYGLTPLIRAINSAQGHEYVEILLTRPDLDVDWPQAGGHGSPLDVAKQTDNMATMALLRGRGAIEPVDSTMCSFCEANLLVAQDVSPGNYFVFEYTQPRKRHGRLTSGSLSQGSRSSSTSDEPDFDYPTGVRESRVHELQKRTLREHFLNLGEQQTNVDELAESTTSLCSSCSAINLRAALWRRHTEKEGKVIADRGIVDETWKNRARPLCRFFATVYPGTSLGKGYKLVSFSTIQSWLCHGEMVRWNNFRYGQLADTMLLAVVATDSWVVDRVDPVQDFRENYWSMSRREKDFVKTAFSSGLIGRLGRNGPYQGSVTIPRLAIEISDWSVARDWITLCRENHSGECNPQKTVNIPHFFLIECSTRHIVPQKKSQTGGLPPYVALSYVWGQSQGRQQPTQRQRQQESLDGVVEPAIEDAISVTLELGYKYLWVDRYCIVQTGDEAIKQDQLRHMHLVYANAEVTLIATAGEDSSAGLPGVPGRPRNKQPGGLIQGHALVCIPPDPSLHVGSNSTWATRGWTYQEGLLARRRLFFSEHEMSYECRHMLCREAIGLPRGVEQRMSGYKPRFMEPFWMYQPYKLPGMDSSRTGIGIFDLLAAYTKQKLSLPLDTLNAMLGIFSLLAQHKTRPMYHICGVPILRLPKHHDRELWERPRSPTASSNNGDTGVATAVSLGGFLDGLCWRLEEPAHRRTGFPSWSWTGWQGVVAGMDKNTTAIKQTNGFAIDVSIIPGNKDGGVAVPWSRCYDLLRMADDSNPDIRSGQNHELEIKASAVQVKFHRGEYESRPNTWIGTVCAGDGVWQGEFFLTSKDVPVSSLLQEQWTGIVLGNSQSQRYTELHDTTVMVIQQQKHEQQRGHGQGHMYYERVGLLCLMHCTLEASMLDQQTWRLS